ncbi:hypothetical protein [Halegenticoccus tardaugens]|uniref:hypothetical protein n=1 Tax=Halegenticoccus tardaugens TaxID=2071624 RepID=UPI00100A8AFA|nr:hypothetical protein [Halegenticoccus tardaugens]
MSIAPRVATPERRVNDYTVIISEGAEDGICEGDELVLSIDDEHVIATVVDVGRKKAVLELSATGY